MLVYLTVAFFTALLIANYTSKKYPGVFLFFFIFTFMHATLSCFFTIIIDETPFFDIKFIYIFLIVFASFLIIHISKLFQHLLKRHWPKEEVIIQFIVGLFFYYIVSTNIHYACYSSYYYDRFYGKDISLFNQKLYIISLVLYTLLGVYYISLRDRYNEEKNNNYYKLK